MTRLTTTTSGTVLILFATREGQTDRIAQRLAVTLRGRGVVAEVVNVGEIYPGFLLTRYSAVIAAASVHRSRHEPEMVEFVKRHLPALEKIPSVFLSVSLSQAGAEDANAPPDRRARAAADAMRMIDQFLAETGWIPGKVKAVAGALAYSQYNFVMRFIMKRIARKSGSDTDTSRDYEYTDWTALDRLAEDLVTA